MRTFRLLFLTALWLCMVGCGFTTANAKVKVVSLSSVLSDFAKQIGGDQVEVTSLIPAGVDPHHFDPTPRDVQKMAEAQLVLVSGKGMEGYLPKLKQALGPSACAKFVSVGDNIPSLFVGSVKDPHWWQSVQDAELAVPILRDALIQIDPQSASTYTANAKAYSERLQKLEDFVQQKVAELPRDQRKLVTSHDSLGYFASEFGFTIYPVEGVRFEEEPSARTICKLIEAIKNQHIKAVFIEFQQNPKILEQIVHETGVKIGGKLYADGLGPEGSDGSTYEDMIRHNVTTIVDGLK